MQEHSLAARPILRVPASATVEAARCLRVGGRRCTVEVILRARAPVVTIEVILRARAPVELCGIGI